MNGIADKKLDFDHQASGGRSGQNVKLLVGPADSVFRGGGERLFVTDAAGRVILDITRDRVKPVLPGVGFEAKRPLTPEERAVFERFFGP